ncbi:MAG: YebC/PmpR family DNA-binding transcriptional regulator [Pseudomonadota bacterium]
MAGHSQWANIRFRKEAQDKRKGKVFTKIIREITIAARLGGGDPNANPRLRASIDKGLNFNMAKDTIDRAIKRGVGSEDDQQLEEIVYEGYGPSGVAMIVCCLTDNRNRTASDVRHGFTKFGGNLGATGCVGYMFQKFGVALCTDVAEDQLYDIALDAGATDIITHDEGVEVRAKPEDWLAVKAALDKAKIHCDVAELRYVPDNLVAVGAEDLTTIEEMIDFFDELDDVQYVYHNATGQA